MVQEVWCNSKCLSLHSESSHLTAMPHTGKGTEQWVETDSRPLSTPSGTSPGVHLPGTESMRSSAPAPEQLSADLVLQSQTVLPISPQLLGQVHYTLKKIRSLCVRLVFSAVALGRKPMRLHKIEKCPYGCIQKDVKQLLHRACKKRSLLGKARQVLTGLTTSLQRATV